LTTPEFNTSFSVWRRVLRSEIPTTHLVIARRF